jgi:metal-responsive CopG/Arc/MetJ family transcriptional regulator
MKTAISIPDNVFQSAEKLAQRLGKSRSQLYTQALNTYLKQNGEKGVQEMLDKVYATEDSSVSPSLRRLQSKVTTKEQW